MPCDRLPKLLDGEEESMYCARNTLKFQGFLGILAHAQTVCTGLSFRVRKEPGVEASTIVATRARTIPFYTIMRVCRVAYSLLVSMTQVGPCLARPIPSYATAA